MKALLRFYLLCLILLIASHSKLLMAQSINGSQSNSQQQSTQQKITEQRIVSAGGSVTEILFNLGINQDAHQHIVATDTSSSFPHAALELPKVGYYRQLSVEGVLSVNPSRVLATKGAGPIEVLQQLEQTGVDIVLFDQAKTVDGLFTLVENIGQQVGQEVKAERLIASLQSQLNNALQKKLDNKAAVVFLMSATERGLMAAGNNTVPHLIMELAGLSNPYAQLDGFKTISVESFLSVAPKHVLIASHTTGGLSAQEICKQPALKLWAAMQGCNVTVVDPLLFLGMTPRLPTAVEEFINIVSPQQHSGVR